MTWAAMLLGLKRAGSWLKANVWALVTALVAMLGAGIFWQYHRGRIRSLEDQRVMDKARGEVAALDARRKVLAEQAVENAAAIAEIQETRVELQRQTVAIEQEVSGMSDSEVEAAFRDLY